MWLQSSGVQSSFPESGPNSGFGGANSPLLKFVLDDRGTIAATLVCRHRFRFLESGLL